MDNSTFVNEFDAPPGTSNFATKKAATNDEVHVLVTDKNGEFSGTKGTVLERYAFLSLGTNAKDDAGANIFVKDVINETSQYVWMVGFDSDFSHATGVKLELEPLSIVEITLEQ